MHSRPFLRSVLAASTLVVGLGCVVGCGGQNEEMSKQLASLQKEMGRLRSANLSLQDRVDMLEEQRTLGTSDVALEEETDLASDRPVLEVVRLAPQRSLAEPEPIVMTPPGDPDAPRPVIVGDGQRVERVDDAAKQKTAPPRWRKKR